MMHVPARGRALDQAALGVAWYRFAATFARRRAGYLAIIVLVGLVGGLAMGSDRPREANRILVVAAAPGRIAARAPTALLLRAE
jgi:hypothetical protein